MTMMIELQSQLDKMDGFYQAQKSQEAALSLEIKGLKDDITLLTKVNEVLKHLLDVMVKDDINRMSGLVTYGLKTIFDDQDLTFKPELTKKNDRIHIELRTVNNGVEGEFGSFGGSVAVIESFLLRLICMLKMNLAHFMLLDETFAPISAEYIQNTSRLIGELSKKLGLDILLVTHQLEFQNYADRVYRVGKSADGLIMEKIR